jgi:hypothetical protein
VKTVVNYYSGLMLFLLAVLSVIPLSIMGYNYDTKSRQEISRYSYPYHGDEPQGNLSIVSGQEVLGMILEALDGSYYVVVDGVRIDSLVNMENVNLRGVLPYNYKISVVRNSQGRVQGIQANVER